MFFNSPSFVILLSLAAILYRFVPVRLRAAFLSVAGCGFYVAASLQSFVFVFVLTLLTYAFGLCLRRRKSGALLTAAVAVVLAAFIVARYPTTLFSHSSGFGAFFVPIGISFITFGFIHYLVDSYRGEIGSHTLSDFMAFSIFPPTLVSGPIKRFQKFSEGVAGEGTTLPLVWTGCMLILCGYLQKYLIADPLAVFTQPLEHPASVASGIAALGGLFLYSLRIYADFAALSNIAIGSSMLFGILVPLNFNYPYFSVNIADFWRRWHMSLGAWIRDYLYIPLGGNRLGIVRLCFNLVIIMTLVGIWHGPTLNFAAWGVWHGVGLAAHRVWVKVRPSWRVFASLPYKLFSIVLTFGFVTVGWAFFLTSSLGDSLLILSKVFYLLLP